MESAAEHDTNRIKKRDSAKYRRRIAIEIEIAALIFETETYCWLPNKLCITVADTEKEYCASENSN